MSEYSFDGGLLLLRGEAVPIVIFAEAPDDPWFKAKPVHNFLGSGNISKTLERVDARDKAPLKDLVAQKGPPQSVRTSNSYVQGDSVDTQQQGGVNLKLTPPNHEDYNEGKATYINESGLYSIILGSRKPVAQEFRRWVTAVVLVSIRRTGGYGLARPLQDAVQAAVQGALAVALPNREGALQPATSQDLVTLKRQGDVLEQEVKRLRLDMEQVQSKAVETICGNISHKIDAQWENDGSATLAIGRAVCGLTAAFGTTVRTVIETAVTAVDSRFVRSLRAAVRLPARRRTVDPHSFPPDQRATPVQKAAALTVASVALQQLPVLRYDAWLRVRAIFGKRAKQERVRRHELGEAHPSWVRQPLLWCCCGAGRDGAAHRYLYTHDDLQMLRDVWHAVPHGGLSVHSLAELAMLDAAEPRDWPEEACELDPNGALED